jgi:hypothetical protein
MAPTIEVRIKVIMLYAGFKNTPYFALFEKGVYLTIGHLFKMQPGGNQGFR